MFKRIKNITRRQPEQTQRVTVTQRPRPQSASQQDPGVFNPPADWEPLDSVLEVTNIPGTSLQIGTAARIFESSRQERVEINQRRGVRPGCKHLIFSVNEVGGTCIYCSIEAAQMLNQGLITYSQAEEHALYCSRCASYCQACLSRQLCVRHTKLYQEPTGRFIPVCPACYELLNPKKGFLKKFFDFLMRK